MARKKPPPKPEDGDPKAETLRQALERNDEKGAQVRKALAEAMRVTVDPSFVNAMAAATQMGPRLEMARQAIQKMAPGIEAIDSMAQHMKGILDSSAIGALGQSLNDEKNLTSSLTIEALRPPQHYILEAQRDTVEAIVDMSALQKQTLTVMGTQVDVLKELQENAAAQTKLNRILLAVAGGTLLAACVIPVIIALVSK